MNAAAHVARRATGDAMKGTTRAQVPHFQFRLRHGVSIGPTALKRLWSAACGCDDVSVLREADRGSYGGSSYRYCLCGPPQLFDLAQVELRLQDTLQAMFPAERVLLFRLESASRPAK